MRILIAGGGRLAYFLSRSLISKGHSITIIDKSEDECQRLARLLKAVVVKGDASRIEILEDAEIMSMDGLLAITSNDADNFVICRLAKIKYTVPFCLAVTQDPDNVELFKELGINSVFSPTSVLSKLLEQRTGFESISFQMDEGGITITEITLSNSAPSLNKMIKDLNLPDQTLIAGIKRGEEAIIPSGLTTLRKNDKLTLVTLPVTLAKALLILTGEI